MTKALTRLSLRMQDWTGEDLGPQSAYNLYVPFLLYFRHSRIENLYRMCGLTAQSKVLDVGGNLFIWKLAQQFGRPLPRLTIADPFAPQPASRHIQFQWLRADRMRLPFRDREFDLVFCNSVIEHLGAWENQVKFASELSRVARSLFVQTPNLWFPVEPHYLAPFLHWLPATIRRGLVPLTPWALRSKSTREKCDQLVSEIRLLTAPKLRRLFPDAEIVKERFLGLTKSLIAVRR
jgi:hypothetical protein